jgi:hypothetical protein
LGGGYPLAEAAAAEIRALDPETLTPLEALQIVYRLRARLRGEG